MQEPVEVKNARGNNAIEIVWDDGVTTVVSYDELRNACPCAACRGHRPGEVEPPRTTGVSVTHIATVGNYALRFEFSDGHKTGIYTFSYLHGLGTRHPQKG